MEKKKKTWTEPKLTALVRRKPEEGILGVCKGGMDTVGPALSDSWCQEDLVCVFCLSQGHT